MIGHRISLHIIVATALCCTAAAQGQEGGGGVPGSGGGGQQGAIRRPPVETTLSIRVMMDNNRPVPEYLRVTLMTNTGVPVSDQFTSGVGMAQFQRLRGGTYTVKVSGAGIEDTTTDQIYISGTEGMRTELVLVKPKDDSNGQPQRPGAPISLSELNIPDKARKEFDKGVSALQKQKIDDARSRFHKALQIYPQYALAWNNLGVIEVKENPEMAKEYFEKAVAADPNLASAQVNLARIYTGKKDYAKAEGLLQKALTADPSDVSALMLLTNSQFELQKFDDALTNGRRVHDLPHERLAFTHLITANILERRGDWLGATKEYEHYLKETPTDQDTSQVRTQLERLRTRVSLGPSKP